MLLFNLHPRDRIWSLRDPQIHPLLHGQKFSVHPFQKKHFCFMFCSCLPDSCAFLPSGVECSSIVQSPGESWGATSPSFLQSTCACYAAHGAHQELPVWHQDAVQQCGRSHPFLVFHSLLAACSAIVEVSPIVCLECFQCLFDNPSGIKLHLLD